MTMTSPFTYVDTSIIHLVCLVFRIPMGAASGPIVSCNPYTCVNKLTPTVAGVGCGGYGCGLAPRHPWVTHVKH